MLRILLAAGFIFRVQGAFETGIRSDADEMNAIVYLTRSVGFEAAAARLR